MSGFSDKISGILGSEEETEEVQSEIAQRIEDGHPEPEVAKKIVGSYRKELRKIRREINVLESTDIFRNHGEVFNHAHNLAEKTIEVIEDISEIEKLLDEWIEALSPVEDGSRPDFEASYRISERLEEILENLPKNGEEGFKVLDNIEEIHEAVKRIYEEAEEAKRELNRIENFENERLQKEESELQNLYEELESLISARNETERVLEDKKEVERKIEEVENDLESPEQLNNKLDEVSELLRKATVALFKFSEVDEEVRMPQLEKAFIVERRLENLPKAIDKLTPDELSRREFITGAMKAGTLYAGIAASGLYSYLTYENVKSIDQIGGGKEQFFSGGEIKSYMNENAVEKSLEGKEVPVNIVHIRFRDDQPSYNKKRFEESLKGPFKKDLGIDIDPLFVELDVRNADIDGSKGYQEKRQLLAKLISNTQIIGGVDEDLFSSPQVDQNTAREIYSRIFYFDKISENMTYGNSTDDPTMFLIISDFKEGEYAGVAHSNFSSHLALVQDKRDQQITEGTAVHELGHNFGLPHTATTQDVMSYSSLGTLLEKIGRPYFSWESKYNWWKLKKTISNQT